MSKQRLMLGRLGENKAVDFLKKKGFRLLERNYRCKLGEIDIIAMKGETLVFVEVRCRSSETFGLPQESVNWRKQSKIRRIAQQYLNARSEKDIKARFDVIAIMIDKEERLVKIEHIENAF